MQIAEFSVRRRFFGLALAILEIAAGLLSSASFAQTAEATDSTAPNSWVNVEIPYFGAQSIQVKMTAVTIGNNLKQGMGIHKIFSSSSSPSTGGSFSISSSVTVEIQRGIVEAVYSADSNTTLFTYTFSSAEENITSFGNFPNDGWGLTITFYTAFPAEFDARTKYGVVPSPYYYTEYTATFSHNDTLGYKYYNLTLKILHPPTFSTFVTWIFYLPMILFTILALICSLLIFIKRKSINELSGTYITICSAVIVFLPVFQLSTQELKTPFTFTQFDGYFLFLLSWYIVLLVVAVVAKATSGLEITKKVKTLFRRTIHISLK